MSSERPWRSLLFVTLVAAGMGGCVDLDGFVHNPVHCSVVGPATCEEKGEIWDQVCLPCDEAYDFGREYPWMAGTLEGGQTLAPLDNGVVERHAIETTDGEGTLDAYFIPALDGSVNGDTTVLYNHGN
ncbi:MAG: hypothetical protein VX938_01770, partial [Myxococcota bacterium]|nr:hypothetical protein [Myxococcota bacterium]